MASSIACLKLAHISSTFHDSLLAYFLQNTVPKSVNDSISPSKFAL